MSKKRVLNPEFKQEVEKVLQKFKQDLLSLHDLATKDEKTGIYNAQFFDNLFDLELERAKRGQQQLSLAIIDIDFFKKFNDTYGHLLGDKILRALAESLHQSIRSYDVLARFGGEEFLVLLPGTTLVKAKKVAERMRKGLRKNSLLKKYGLTISLGVTQFKEKDSKKRMIARADKALYEAKKLGRNQVIAL